MLTTAFLNICQELEDKVAFYYLEKGKVKTITYGEVLKETYALKTYLIQKLVNIDKPILLLMKPSKLFYLTIFASMFLNIKIVIIDKFKNLELVKKKLEISDVGGIFVDSTTNKLTHLFKLFKKYPKINVSNFPKSQNNASARGVIKAISASDTGKAGLITFTTGTTGLPKAVFRSLEELANQVNFLEHLDFSKVTTNIVLPLLPVYPIFTFLKGVSTFLYFQNNYQKLSKYLKQYQIEVVIASVSAYLHFSKPLYEVKKAFMGGSMLRLKDARRIKNSFPNATFHYIYGATEAVVMAHITLGEYLNNLEKGLICLGREVEKGSLSIENDELVISHKVVTNKYLTLKPSEVLTSPKHYTGDLGFKEDDLIYLLGKKAYSLSFRPYNYELELLVSNEFSKIKQIAIFSLDKKSYEVCLDVSKVIPLVKKFLNEKYPNLKFNFHYLKKLPIDERHQYKINYPLLSKKITSGVK